MEGTEKKTSVNIELGQRMMLRSPMDDLITIRVMKTDAEKCSLQLKHPNDFLLTIEDTEGAGDAEN